jgi:hypothetical protein
VSPKACDCYRDLKLGQFVKLSSPVVLGTNNSTRTARPAADLVNGTAFVSIAGADIKHQHLSLVKYMGSTRLEKSPIRRFMVHGGPQRNWVRRLGCRQTEFDLA